MKNIFKGILVLFFAFIFIPFVNAEIIDFAELSVEMPIDGQSLIDTCTANEDTYSCRLVKWYKGGSELTPGEEATGTYVSGLDYILEVAVSATEGNEFADGIEFGIIGLPEGHIVETNQSGEIIVRFLVTPNHVVSFETYGGTEFDDLIVENMDSVSETIGSESLPVPEKEGYTFYGWYTDPDFEDEFSTHLCIEESITIYAQFIDNNNIITSINVLLDGPTVGDQIETSTHTDHGALIEEQNIRPFVRPASEGVKYSVSGFWVKGSCKNESELCYQKYDGTIAKDTEYYASIDVEAEEGYKFHPTNLTIKVNGENPEELFGIYGGSFTWFIAKAESIEKAKENCEINFDMNGGSLLEGYGIKCGGSATLPNPRDVNPPKGKILDGWTWGGNTYHPGEEVEIDEDKTFTAVWVNMYTVTFDLNGKVSTFERAYQIKEGGLAQAPDETPKSHGFIFQKWCKDAECTDTFEFESETITKDTTIYAGWIDDPDIFDIKLSTSTYRVMEGLLPEFVVLTNTPSIDIEDYGSNTTWMHWAEGYSSWHGFGSEEKIAVADGTTHYALRLQLNLMDGRKFSDDVRIYLNNEDITNVGHTMLDKGFSWGGYLYIDLGLANKKDVVKPTLNIKADNNKFTLSWEDQMAAEKYELQYSFDGKRWSKLYTGNAVSYKHKSLMYNYKYYYRVRAYGNKKWSKYSDIVSKKVVPNKVVNLSVKSAGTNNVKLTYDKVSSTGYEIYNSTDNKKWTKVATVTKNATLEYNVKKLKSNKTYYFKVRAYKTVSGKKIYGKYSSVVSTKTAPEKPSLSLSLKSLTEMNLKIGSVKGASVYQVQKSLDGKTYTTLENLPSSGTLVAGELEIGNTYYFKVRACNSQNRCSGWVTQSLMQTTKTPKLTLSTTSKKVKSVLTKVEGADGYKLYMATSKSGKYTTIKEFTSEDELLEYTTKTKKGTTYYFKVRSYKVVDSKKVYSPYSSIKSITSK